MNVIVIVNDTLRRDHVAAYGAPAPWSRPGHEGEPFIHTPNLDRLAAESAVFDRFYCFSYPTIPCRYDQMTGRYGFPFKGWQPLEPDDVVLSEIVRKRGYTPMLIFDTPPLGNDDYNFTRGFAGWWWIRGQHQDRFVTDPIEVTLPAAPHKLKSPEATRLYLRNTAERRYERDWMCGRTTSAAMDWLERNYTRDGFVLWIDMWDPHEPFDAPAYDVRRYADPGYRGEWVIYPRYGRHEYLSPEEASHVRALYASLVTLCDRWLGRFLEKVETLGLDRNTLVVYTTDHGHLFGEHDLEGKPTGSLGKLYEVTTRIPLMIRHPKGVGAGRRVQGIAQQPDLLPTILEFLDVPIPETVQGKSLWPLISGEADRIRDFALSGRFPIGAGVPLIRAQAQMARVFDGYAGSDLALDPITITTEDWALICPPAGGPRELYDLRGDPGQLTNLAAVRPDVADDLQRKMLGFLEEIGTPERRIAPYRPGHEGRGRPLTPGPSPAKRERGAEGGVRAIEPDRPLYVVEDGRGHRLAFPTEAEARECLVPALPVQEVRKVPFGSLLEEDAKALVHVYEQYYWASDLA